MALGYLARTATIAVELALFVLASHFNGQLFREAGGSVAHSQAARASAPGSR